MANECKLIQLLGLHHPSDPFGIMFNTDSLTGDESGAARTRNIRKNELNFILQGFYLPLPYFLVLCKAVNQHDRNPLPYSTVMYSGVLKRNEFVHLYRPGSTSISYNNCTPKLRRLRQEAHGTKYRRTSQKWFLIPVLECSF